MEIAKVNKEGFAPLTGDGVRIGRIHPEQLDEFSCILQGYIKYKESEKRVIKTDKAVWVVGGDKNEHWSLMQEAMIIGNCSTEEPTSWIRIRDEDTLFKTDFSEIKFLIIAGSFESDMDPQPYMKNNL